MDFLNGATLLLDVAKPTGMWEYFIFGLESLVKNYGLTIILITLAIKLLMLPFDILNRYINKRNSAKMAEIQPDLEKIQKRYGSNKEVLNQKTMEVYKKHNYNVMGSCFGMLINMVATMVIFFTLFSGLNKIASYKIYSEYETLQQVYAEEIGGHGAKLVLPEGGDTVKLELEDGTIVDLDQQKVAIANQKVINTYGDIKEGFLWIKNIWRPDTSASIVLNYKDFKSNTKLSDSDENTYFNEKVYNQVTDSIRKNEKYSGWNGYYILILLSAGVTYLSTQVPIWLGQAKARRQNKPYVDALGQNKIMLYLMPAIMALFTLFYNAMFAIYIVTGALFGLITSPLVTMLVDKMNDKKTEEENKKVKVSYSRR